MYMESSKMVLITSMQGGSGDADIGNRLGTQQGKEGAGWIEGLGWQHVHHHM